MKQSYFIHESSYVNEDVVIGAGTTNFNYLEFEAIENGAGLNSFVLTPNIDGVRYENPTNSREVSDCKALKKFVFSGCQAPIGSKDELFM